MAKKKDTGEELNAKVEETVNEEPTVETPTAEEKTEEKAEEKKKPARKCKTTAKKATEAETKEVEPDKEVETKKDIDVPQNPIAPEVQIERVAGLVEVKRKEETSNNAEELTIEQKLLSLYHLQQICSKIDEIRMIRGELPEEVQDKEDECEGKRTRIAKKNDEIKNLKNKIASENTKIQESELAIKKYEDQQNHVRNNREYESLTKEIEYQKLVIQVANKHNNQYQAEIVENEEKIAETKEILAELEDILKQKKAELDVIIADTEKEEKELLAKAEVLKSKVDKRLLTAFERIRKNAHNGLAIVQIDRDACGGCFSKIPPQRQLDIRLHKKIIVCEACGRIFIDHQLVESEKNKEAEENKEA